MDHRSFYPISTARAFGIAKVESGCFGFFPNESIKVKI